MGILDYYGQAIPNDDGNKIYFITFTYCVKYLNSTICDDIPAVICGDRIENQLQVYIYSNL